mgnify:FL=1
MLRRIKLPYVTWLILLSLVFTPFFIEFKTKSVTSNENETYTEMVERINNHVTEINKCIKNGQIGVDGKYMFIYGVYVFLFFIIILYLLIEEEIVKILIFNLKHIQTKEGSYFYKLDTNCYKLTVYKANVFMFEEYDSVKLNRNTVTASDITTYLERIAAEIDQANLSYIKEEMTTRKRIKTK